MKPSRREILATLGAGAVAAGCGGDWTPSPGRTPDPDTDWPDALPEDLSAFPLGAMGGDPLHDAVVLWTRYDGTGTLELRFALYQDGTWSAQPAVPVTPADGGYTHHDLRDLPADTPVAFQFVDDTDAASTLAVTRTAAAPGTDGVVRIVATSCSKLLGEGTFPTMPNALQRGPVDVVIWGGDTVYTYDNTLAEYRLTWERNYETPEFREFFATGAHVFTWDDHEVTNNWEGATVNANLRALGTQAFFEHTPIRRHEGEPDRIWRSFRFGDIVEVFVLDCRSERDFDAQQYISRAQMDWLKEGLSASAARWKCIVNSVPIADMPEVFNSIGDVVRDSWRGYPDQWRELLDHIATVPGVVVLSGDHHMPAVGRLELEGPGRNVWDIMMGPTGSNPIPVGALMLLNPDTYGDQFPWSESIRTATRLEFDSAGFLRVTFIDDDDNDVFTGLFDDRGRLLWHEVVLIER